MTVLAIDIGGTNTRSGLFAAPGRCLESRSVPNRRWGDRVAPEAFIEYVAKLVDQAQSSGAPVDAIGIAAAAVVDAGTGHVHVGENVGWRDLSLGARLQECCRLPVRIDTDAFCGALAEARLGAGSDWQSFLYVTIGTGIGHGWILDGAVWRGAQGAANVFGHMKVMKDGEPCYCGGAGCLCLVASGAGLAHLAQRIRPAHAGWTAEEVIEAAVRQESWAAAIVDQALDKLALALSGAYNLIDMEGVVLDGGAVSDRYPDLNELTRRLEVLVYPTMRPIVLRRSVLQGESVLQGAALLAFNALESAACD